LFGALADDFGKFDGWIGQHFSDFAGHTFEVRGDFDRFLLNGIEVLSEPLRSLPRENSSCKEL